MKARIFEYHFIRVATMAGLLVAAMSPIAYAASPGPLSTQFGEISDGTCGIITAFEQWLGQPAGSVRQMVYYGPAEASTVAGWESAIKGAKCGYNTRPLSISFGISDTAANILAGKYNSLLSNIGVALQAAAPTAILRLNWEFNGNWFPWGIDSYQNPQAYTPSQFIAVWQYEVNTIRAAANASGANSITFEWNADLCGGCTDMATAWPGSAYVDYIGLDAYDGNNSGNYANDWTNYWVLPNGHNGLAEQLALAEEYGKGMDFGELGLGMGPNGRMDDAHGAAMVPYLASWMSNSGANANGYERFAYFNVWNTNEGSYCGVIDGEGSLGPGTCPPPTENNTGPATAGPPYEHPLTAAAFLSSFYNIDWSALYNSASMTPASLGRIPSSTLISMRPSPR